MPVPCPAGYTQATQIIIPADSTTPNFTNNTYVKKTYDLVKVSNHAPFAAACNTQETFKAAFSTTLTGTVTVQPLGVGGGTGGGSTNTQSISITVGGDNFQYHVELVYIEETVEKGTVTTSGGFVKKGAWNKFKAFVSLLFGGSMLPSVTYNKGTITKQHISVLFKVCKIACKKKVPKVEEKTGESKPVENKTEEQ